MSYLAIVCRLTNVRKHPNADRLSLATVLGNQVIVGMDNHDGELGVFFGPDGQLSEEMLVANDLVARKDPETGEHRGGYFSENGRVRAQRLRGIKSDGYWTSLSALAWTGADSSSLKEGDAFDTLNAQRICNKYYTPATLRAMKGGQKVKRGETLYFRKHFDTPQFRHVAATIPVGAIVWITTKIHGSSHRIARVLDDVPLPRWKQWVNRFYPLFPDKAFAVLNGSRNVILERTEGQGWYGDNDFRDKALHGVTLRKGECLFLEIAGYVNETTPIMGDQHVKDKELIKTHGRVMRYSYGATPGEQKVFVYRITNVNEDGHVTELPWLQMAARCKELGLPSVPLLTGPLIYDGNIDALKTTIETHAEGVESLDPSHIREGVVLRAESEYGTIFAKHKQWLFLYLEGVAKDNPEFVDTEEVA